MTSVKVKFRPSKVTDKPGVLYLQFIHERKVQLVTTSFRLYPGEWNSKSQCIVQSPGKGTSRLFFWNRRSNG